MRAGVRRSGSRENSNAWRAASCQRAKQVHCPLPTRVVADVPPNVPRALFLERFNRQRRASPSDRPSARVPSPGRHRRA
jgi:hypothetical protein